MKHGIPVCFGSAVLASVAYLASAFLACTKYPLPFSPARNWLSDLGNQVTNPEGAVYYNAGVVLTALFLAIWFTAGLAEWRLEGNSAHQKLLLASQSAGLLSAIGLMMSAIYPINFYQVHSFWSQIHFMMFGMGFGFSVAALRYHIRFRQIHWILGTCAALMPTLMLIFGHAYWLEWIAVGCIIAYTLSLGISSLLS